MRKFIRHPADIPIKYHIKNVVADEKDYLDNISTGGLCLRSNMYFDPGVEFIIEIPLLDPIFKAEGKVVWCHKQDSYYETGIEFSVVEEKQRIRMVEQICHIEHYKREVLEKEGRELTGEEAAVEWIQKFAKDFPEI